MVPFELIAPSGAPAPLLFDSPHSGRSYPEDFRYAPPLDLLRRGEDAYVDELIADGRGHGATLLLAHFPRCYIDLNREVEDIDAELLAEPWPTPLHPSEKTRRGIGLIRRYVIPGVAVHRDRLAVAEVQRRIDEVYLPYHRALRVALDGLRARHGFVWHIDWHSMKSMGNALTPDGDKPRPDFVIGDLDGTSCEPALTALVAETLSGLGYRVAINDPYKGAAIIHRYGVPAQGFHSLQIEMSRALYLDEATVERNAGWSPLQRNLARLAERLAAAARARRPRAPAAAVAGR